MSFTPRLFVVVGTPGSGKDLLVRAVIDLGTQHARVVPKHTTRQRRQDDGPEMICPNDPRYKLDACDVTYENYGEQYGIETATIWEGLMRKVSQVAVASGVDAINALRSVFGDLLVLVYVHSEKSADEYLRTETPLGEDTEYVRRRVASYQRAFDLYLENFLTFDHVLIYSGSPEDLYDQIFRLFRAYEHAEL